MRAIREENEQPKLRIDLFENKRTHSQEMSNEEIYQENKFLKNVLNLGQIGAWRVHLQSNKIEWSDSNYRIFGIPKGASLSFGLFLKCVHPEDRKFVSSKWNTALKGKPYDIEYRVLTNTDTEWVREKAKIEYNRNGEPIFIVGITQNITDIKNAENEINKAKTEAKEKEKQFVNQKHETEITNTSLESLLKISQFQTDSIKKILDITLIEVLKLTGSKYGYILLYDDEANQIKNIYNIKRIVNNVAQETKLTYRYNVTGIWKEVLAQRAPVIYNKILGDYYLFSDGNKKTVKISRLLTVPLKHNNKIVAIIEVANKESDYNELDIKQLTLLMDGVIRITERIELVNKLKKAKEKAEESERLKTAFLQNISHEIRTPMNAINGFSKLLLRSNIPDEKKQSFLSIIINSTNQLLSIVTDVLTISAIDSKQEKLDLLDVDINKLLSEMEMVFSKITTQKGIEISIKNKLDDSNSRILSDRIKLTQILNNLIANAIKFTKKGKVEFGCIRKQGILEFFVKDTGMGIEQEQFEKIFARFYQVDMKTNREFGGTGLGLAISKEFIDILQGKIWLESELGKGTTFFFSIPFIPAPALVEKTNKDGARIQSLGLTILIAEDERSNFQLIQELLQSTNCRIIHAEDGNKAIEAFDSNLGIDLILMDIKMPNMEGHVAARVIKKLNPKVPIIAQTAYALPSEIKKYAVIFDDYITKPIEEDALFKIIKKYGDKKAAQN